MSYFIKTNCLFCGFEKGLSIPVERSLVVSKCPHCGNVLVMVSVDMLRVFTPQASIVTGMIKPN
jgi:hypothetical protein